MKGSLATWHFEKLPGVGPTLTDPEEGCTFGTFHTLYSRFLGHSLNSLKGIL